MLINIAVRSSWSSAVEVALDCTSVAFSEGKEKSVAFSWWKAGPNVIRNVVWLSAMFPASYGSFVSEQKTKFSQY